MATTRKRTIDPERVESNARRLNELYQQALLDVIRYGNRRQEARDLFRLVQEYEQALEEERESRRAAESAAPAKAA